MNDQENTLFAPDDMQLPFDAIKEVDEEGREWWNSRRLARLMGYMKYWNFERLMDKDGGVPEWRSAIVRNNSKKFNSLGQLR